MAEPGPRPPTPSPPGEAEPGIPTSSPSLAATAESPSSWPDRARLAWCSLRASHAPSRSGVVAAVVVATVAALALALAFALVRWSGGSSSPPELVLPRAPTGSTPPPGPGGAGAPPAEPSTVAPTPTPGGLATVDAAGAVAHPGVYVVAAGGRVADVVTAAGGAVAGADLDRLNLAARVADGDRVYVPRRGEGAPPAGVGSAGTAAAAGAGPPTGPRVPTPDAPLDLNLVDEAQLETLPGVGPAIARAVVAFRQRRGRFRSVDELIDVPGIGPAKLGTIRALVRV